MNLLPPTPHRTLSQPVTRRQFLRACPTGAGAAWLAAGSDASAAASPAAGRAARSPSGARAKHVIHLHLAGGPSQLDLFQFKPELRRLDGTDCPAEFLPGRDALNARSLPVPKLLGPLYPFARHGESGAWVSDRLPHFSQQVDSVSFIHTMQSDQLDHARAQCLFHTGYAAAGGPSLGSWVAYALGTESQTGGLPAYVVLGAHGDPGPIAGDALWGAGFLPAACQGIGCRGQADPVLFLSDPAAVPRPPRGEMINTIGHVQRLVHQQIAVPAAAMAQGELAFRMHAAAREAVHVGRETAASLRLYGAQPGRDSFANRCLLARRLVERGVRYVQLFDAGWDAHGGSPSESINGGFRRHCQRIDRPLAALLADLRRSGLLEETVIVVGGEFGRAPVRDHHSAGSLVGRGHHGQAYTVCIAGGGVKPGVSYGQTDALGFGPVDTPVRVVDLQATILHLLGVSSDQLAASWGEADGLPWQRATKLDALIA